MIVMDVLSDPNEGKSLEDKKQVWHEMRITNMGLADALPRNTIIAKRVGEDVDPMFVFPFFPSHLALPCKPGEAVWVMVENPNAESIDVAYWFCRIVEPHMSDDVNHAHPGRSFETSMYPGAKERHDNENRGTAASGENVWHELRNSPPVKVGDDRESSKDSVILMGESEDVFEKLITESDAASLTTYEAVPRFRKRPGDVVLEGSNNSLIVLGTDRPGPISIDDKKTLESSGLIDIVVGRGQTETTLGKVASTTSTVNAKGNKKGKELKKELNKSPDVLVTTEGDPDLKNDRSRIYVAQKTEVDKNFGIDEYNMSIVMDSNNQIKDSKNGDPAIVLKSDKVRLIARQDLEIIVTGFDEEKTPNGNIRKDEKSDTKKWASIVVKTNGDIVFTPSDKGVIKLGGDDADLAVLCEKSITGANNAQTGMVSASPIIDTMGGAQGTGAAGQGQFAKKVLLK